MPLSSGTRLGPYEVLSAIGAGGMGEVYKARDTRLDRTVAIKVLSPNLLPPTPSVAGASSSEAQRRLRASTIPTSAPSTTSAARLTRDFLVMEYLEGHALADRLAQGAAAARTRRCSVGVDVRGRAGRCAQAGDHPSGPQTWQRHADEGGRQTAGLRPRAPDRHRLGRQRRERAQSAPSDECREDGALHGAGAGRGAADRRPHGHLGVRHGPLRDADRAARVQGRSQASLWQRFSSTSQSPSPPAAARAARRWSEWCGDVSPRTPTTAGTRRTT